MINVIKLNNLKVDRSGIYQYDIVSPFNRIKGNVIENNDDDLDDEMSYAIGDNFRKNQKIRQQRRNQKVANKSGAKLALANAQVESAKASAKGVDADISLAKSLKSKGSAKDKPMSTSVKVGIAVGVFVLLSGIGYVVYKKYKKK